MAQENVKFVGIMGRFGEVTIHEGSPQWARDQSSCCQHLLGSSWCALRMYLTWVRRAEWNMELTSTWTPSGHPGVKWSIRVCRYTSQSHAAMLVTNSNWFPYLSKVWIKADFGVELKVNGEFISFQFFFFPLCLQFICLYLSSSWEIIMSELLDFKNHKQLSLKRPLRYLPLLL